MPSVPILMYHEVSPVVHPAFRRFTVRPERFERQMRWLVRAGYRAVSLDQLVAARRGEGTLPPRPVVITFDDAFVDSGRYAPPILRQHGLTATFFVVAGLVGRPGEWLQREVGLRLPLMGWAELRTLQAAGLDIGSHTVSHPRLATLAAADCLAELTRSRAILEDGLSRRVSHLAYPFGSHDDAVVARAAEAGYASACTTLEGRSRDEPLLRLRRVPVYGTESPLDFATRLLTARSLAELLSHATRHRRQLAGAIRGLASR